jgi:hypothetical protein
MGRYKYLLPDSCQRGTQYYLRMNNRVKPGEYKKVLFLAYRPHPGELVVQDGDCARVIYRADLFLRKEDNGKDKDS